MRRFIRRDKNHLPVVNELRKRGVFVLDLAESGKGVTDIVTCYRGSIVFIEIKIEEKDSYLKKSQVKFLGTFPGYCGIARNKDQAYKLATDPAVHALTRQQKEKLLGYHERMGALTRMDAIFKLIGREA